MPQEILAPLDPRQRYTVKETCAYLRKSRAALYAEIRSGSMPVIRDGRRTYIAGETIVERSRPPKDSAA